MVCVPWQTIKSAMHCSLRLTPRWCMNHLTSSIFCVLQNFIFLFGTLSKAKVHHCRISYSMLRTLASHWNKRIQVSWVWFPVTAGLFTFPYFRLITSYLQLFTSRLHRENCVSRLTTAKPTGESGWNSGYSIYLSYTPGAFWGLSNCIWGFESEI